MEFWRVPHNSAFGMTMMNIIICVFAALDSFQLQNIEIAISLCFQEARHIVSYCDMEFLIK